MCTPLSGTGVYDGYGLVLLAYGISISLRLGNDPPDPLLDRRMLLALALLTYLSTGTFIYPIFS